MPDPRVVRCFLWGGRCGVAQCGCDDGRIYGSDGLHSVYCRALYNVQDQFEVSERVIVSLVGSLINACRDRRSSRSKRKLERKVGSGRKGTVDEEEYLLKSVTKLTTRFDGTQGASQVPSVTALL